MGAFRSIREFRRLLDVTFGAPADGDVPQYDAGTDKMVVAPLTGVPPGGAAGGDLTGTYPNPQIAPGVVTPAELSFDPATQAELDAHVSDPTAAHPATAVSYAGGTGMAATEVEGAIDELANEKANVASAVMDGDAAAGVLSGTYPNPGFAVDMATQAELDALAAAAAAADAAVQASIDAHVADPTDAHDAAAVSFLPAGTIAATTVQEAIEEVALEAAAGGAPSGADYLVGTTQAGLSAEIVVGPTPGGELGGTWAAPTVDAVHSGSSHAAAQAAAEATAAAALAAHLADPTDAHDAGAVSYVPTGNLAADDVQEALDELDTEKAATVHTHAGEDINSGTIADGRIAASIARDSEVAAGDAAVQANLDAHIADPTDAHPASAVGIVDAAGDFTATEVEGALAELQAADEADEAALAAHLADSSDAHDASAISVDSTTLVGTGTDVQAALEELDNGIADHLADATAAHAATAVAFTPAGTISATDVQAAIEEVASEAGAASINYETRSTVTILGAADKGKTIDITAAITQTFEADETLGDGWWVILRNATDEGTVEVVLNPAGAETIDGLTTVTMYSGESRLIVCNGAGGNFNSVLLSGGFRRFTVDGNFILPHGITEVIVECIGGGGGGAGGRGGAAASVRQGGCGGGGGARVQRKMAAAALGNPGDVVAVDVAAGGAAGAGGSSADGGNGVVGGNTTFGAFVTGYGGGPGISGGGGTARAGGGGGGEGEAGQQTFTGASGRGGGNGTAGAVGMGGAGGGGVSNGAGASAEYGGGGGGGNSTGGDLSWAGGTSVWGGGGGGGGAGLTTGNVEDPGIAGGDVGVFVLTGGGGGLGGAADGGAGGAGAAGDLRVCGKGGGGGGSQASGTGGVGGVGGAPGGGGGGGAGGTSVGGAGAAGGIGECRVWYS